MKSANTITADTVDCVNDGHVVFIILSAYLWRNPIKKIKEILSSYIINNK